MSEPKPTSITDREVAADALRAAADSLYLNGKGEHNEGAKNWLHRRANLIDPRTRDSMCDHGYPKSGACSYCRTEVGS